jgi:hypothetical protein
MKTPQTSRQTTATQTHSPLAALLDRPHVPSPVARFTVPPPQKRKYKMVWVEIEAFTEVNVCAICRLADCSYPERDIRREKHITRIRKCQYID